MNSPATPAPAAAKGWYRCPQPRPQSRVRLVFFPHAGGTAAFYRGWAGALPPAVEVHCAQYPGHGDRIAEDCARDISELVEAAADALTPLTSRPVALFGHSLGAAVAYEVARLLERRGAEVAHLFLSGRPAPHRQRDDHVHQGGDEDLLDDVRRLGGTDEEALRQPQLRSVLLPVLRADYQISETYRAVEGPPLRTPVTALLGDQDPEVNHAEATAWCDVTEGATAVRAFPGDHFYLVRHQAEVAETVCEGLGIRAPQPVAWPSTP